VILVTGATGRVGYRLMEALADARADVTAMVRVEAEAADLPGSPEHVVASLDDPPPASVLRQCDRIFLLSPEIEEQVELERAFIDAVAKAGNRPQIVKVVADGFQDPGCEVRYMQGHRQIAYHLDAVGLPATFLAAATYMDDLLGDAAEIQRTGEIRAAAGHGRAGFIAASDVALVAARVLTTDAHEGETYVLTGPESLGYAAVAHKYSSVFGRKVDYADLPGDRIRDLLLERGRTPWQADGDVERFDWIKQGGADTVTGTVRELTGSGPRPLEEWLADERETFDAPL
jgi:NAD(P)H dehydrogenase (quinone)